MECTQPEYATPIVASIPQTNKQTNGPEPNLQFMVEKFNQLHKSMMENRRDDQKHTSRNPGQGSGQDQSKWKKVNVFQYKTSLIKSHRDYINNRPSDVKLTHEDGSPIHPSEMLLQKMGVHLGGDISKTRNMAGILGNRMCQICVCILGMFLPNLPKRTIWPHIMANKKAPTFAKPYNAPKNCPMLLHVGRETREQILERMQLRTGCARVPRFCSYTPNKECNQCNTTFIHFKCSAGQDHLDQKRREYNDLYQAMAKSIFPSGQIIPTVGKTTTNIIGLIHISQQSSPDLALECTLDISPCI